METQGSARIPRRCPTPRPPGLMAAAGAVAALAVWLLTPATATPAGHAGIFGLMHMREDFTGTTAVDSALTTAVVDTRPPGTVYLPSYVRAAQQTLPGLVAFRPDRLQVAVASAEGEAGEDGAQAATTVRGFASDGSGRIRELAGWRLLAPDAIRALAWSGDGAHLGVALADRVEVYGEAEAGLRRVAVLPAAPVSHLALAPERSFWLVAGTVLRRFAWDGGGYRELPDQGIPVQEPVAVSGGRLGNGSWALAVLDGTTVRYFVNAGETWREQTPYRAAEQDGIGVALTGDGGFMVLLRDPAAPDGTARRAVYYGIGGGAARRSVEGVLEEPAWGIAAVPAGAGTRDFAVMSAAGIDYYGWSGSGWRRNQSRDISGPFLGTQRRQESGYEAEGWLYSRIWQTAIPVGRVRASVNAQVLAATRVELAVTTDGGATWTPVGVAQNADVPPGTGFGYRVRLTTTSGTATPVLDSVEFRQVVYRDVRAQSAGRAVRVRLVR